MILKFIFTLVFLISFNTFANSNIAGDKCRLDISMYLYEPPAGFYEEIRSILSKKGYTGLEFLSEIDLNDKERFLLYFGTETRVFNFKTYAYMVLSDERKLSTDEKYLYSVEKWAYNKDLSKIYRNFTLEVPPCRK